jgi:L-ascorbate metabolism protein UlaG (beta-lactamase superfamily)
MDPFGKGMGYRVPTQVPADVVTTSHDHFDHNNIAAAKGNFEHIHTAGSFTTRISASMGC